MAKAGRVIGVREFRAHLSAHLRNVAEGGEVVIGDRRRRPLARLVPARPGPDDTHLAQLARRGIVELGAGKPGGAAPIRPRRAGRLASDLVREGRG